MQGFLTRLTFLLPLLLATGMAWSAEVRRKGGA